MLIASAAAELKRQQEEQLEKEVAEAEARSGGLGSQSLSAGRLPSATMVSASAPADINAATIAVMAGLEEKFSTAGIGEEKSVDGMMEHEAYFPLTGGSDGGGGGMRGRASSLAEPGSGGGAATAMKPTSLTMKARVSPGGPRWRGGVLGTPGMGSSPGSGSIIGAGKLGVQCFTCTVGKKPSQATTYVNDIDEVSAWSWGGRTLAVVLLMMMCMFYTSDICAGRFLFLSLTKI